MHIKDQGSPNDHPLHIYKTTHLQAVFQQIFKMSLTQNIKSAFETWVDGPPKSRPSKVQVNGQGQNGEKKIYFTKSELQQIISNQIEKRLNPLVNRIKYLQTQLKQMQMQNGKNKPSLHYSDDNGIGIDIDDGINICKFQSESKTNDKPTPSSQQSLNSNDLSKQSNLQGVSSAKRQSTFTLKDAEAHCSRLDQVSVHFKNLSQWTSWCRLIKNIFRDRATRIKKIWTIEQQKIIVTFVLFGHSQLGLTKKQMVALAGVSESSFKRWRRTFEGREKE